MDQNVSQTPPSAPAPNQAPHPAPHQPAGPKVNMLMGILAYILFFIPMITGDSKKDEFVKFHTKQGFALFIVNIALYVLGWIIPWYFWWQVSWILSLGVFALFVLGVVNVVNGKKAELPVIGKLGEWLKI